MARNLLFLVLKIKNLWAPPPKRFYSARGVGGPNYIILLLYKSTYIARNALSTNPVKSRVHILIKNKGMALWEFCMALWEFCMALWEFYFCFKNRVIHRLSTIAI